jgi:hypothetical protein
VAKILLAYTLKEERLFVATSIIQAAFWSREGKHVSEYVQAFLKQIMR